MGNINKLSQPASPGKTSSGDDATESEELDDRYEVQTSAGTSRTNRISDAFEDSDEEDESTRSSRSHRPGITPDLKFVRVNIQDPPDAELEALSYTLNGIEWGGGSKPYKRKFSTAFTEAMRSVDITGPQKLMVMQRYARLVNHYQRSTRRWEIFSYSARFIVTVGSMTIPVLLALDDDLAERTTFGQAVAYSSIAVGFTVSLVNGFQELLQSTKQFITSSNTKSALIAEGWSFVSMSGRYERFESHSECWRSFFERVQKMDAAAHNISMSIARGGDEKLERTRPGGEQVTVNAVDIPVVFSEH